MILIELWELRMRRQHRLSGRESIAGLGEISSQIPKEKHHLVRRPVR